MTDQDALARFLELVAREMDTIDVRAEPRGTVEPAQDLLIVPLGAHSEVVVHFDEVPPDVEARQRRLEMLATAFASAIEVGARRPRPSRRSLRRELEKLADRAGAIDAVVIDAHSPIVWGAVAGPLVSSKTNVIPLNAESRARVERIHDSHRDLLAAIGGDDESPDDERTSVTPAPIPPSQLTTRAVAEIRALPATAMLHRGGHLAYNRRDADYGVVARSFAAIYVVLLVFDRAFDMIRAERALREGLPMVERMVLALPPLDPEPAPTAGVVAIRRPRRRR